MIYIGMDVHQKSTTICIQDDTGKQVFLGSCPTTFSGFSETLRPWLEKHPGAPGMEACSKAYSTSGIVVVLGGCPQVYPADEVAKKTRSRKKKTDTRDAQDLCTNLRTGALGSAAGADAQASFGAQGAGAEREDPDAGDQRRQGAAEGVRPGWRLGKHEHPSGLEKAARRQDARDGETAVGNAFRQLPFGLESDRRVDDDGRGSWP